MKSGRILLLALLSLSFLISACQDQEKKQKQQKDYSGVSELLADRNKARRGVADSTPSRKIDQIAPSKTKDNPTDVSKKNEVLPIILYEEDVKIVGSSSGKTLAKGVAYINKKGQIVRIKLLRE